MLRRVSWSQGVLAIVFVFAVIFGSISAPERVNANPRYAALVVDARNGEVLFSRHANAPRFPASLTKVMTLYVLFEELEAGRLSLDTRMRVSTRAEAQRPSELGLRQGQTISVRDAMLSLVTKSANDSATVIAEHISGTESEFARRMTRTARAIGMRATTFRNASGWPNPEQRTTAHDMVLMGRAIYERFPQRYQVFGTRSFRYAGRTYRNHNRLLGTVRGVDGIKTGYIRASGFNLLSSVNDRGRHIVAVVMGGRSGASRNAHMTDLINRHLPSASTGPRTARLVIARAQFQPPSPVPHPASLPITATALAPTRQPSRASLPTSLAAANTVAVTPPSEASQTSVLAAPAPTPVRTASIIRSAGTERSRGTIINGLELGTVPDEGWTIQIGALPSQDAAVAVLAQAKGTVADLNARTPYTQSVNTNGTTLWRARFSGFSNRDSARSACSALEARDFACLAVRPDR